MLTQYVRHKASTDLIAQHLDSFDPSWLAGDERDSDEGDTAKFGLMRYNTLAAMLERETRTLNALDRSMRLTQQSKIRAEKVIKSQAGRKPWQLEND